MHDVNDYLHEALALARTAQKLGEVPVGAVLVDSRNGAILSRAHNRTRLDHDPTAHAEILCLRAAAAATGDERLSYADLYVTLEPCTMCAAALSMARLRRLYYGAYDIKGGAVDHGVRFFSQPSCHHAPEVYGGIAAAACSALLRDFFKERRF